SREGQRDSMAPDEVSNPPGQTNATPLDPERLTALRRQAAAIERPLKGVYLQVKADGTALTTGPKGLAVPESFRSFAHENGLPLYVARRGDANASRPLHPTVGNAPHYASAAMPIPYRESGAIYYSEMGDPDRMSGDRAVFSRSGQRTPGTPAAPGKWDSPESTRLDTFLYEFQDKVIDLKRVQAAIERVDGQLSDETDTYLGEELYYNKIAHRIKEFTKREIKPLLTDMRARRVTIADIEEYMKARHAEERNIQIATVNPAMPDGGSGMTTSDAKDYLAGLDPAKKRAYAVLAQRVDDIIKGTRNVLLSEGLETQATIDAWEKTYVYYVPLHRDEAHPEASLPIGAGYSVRGSSSKRATGSAEKVTNILGHVLAQREVALTRAEKNNVQLRLYATVLAHPNPDFWNADKPPSLRGIHPRTGMVYNYTDPAYRDRPDVLMLRLNGEDRSITFNAMDPRAARLAESLKNFDIDEINRALLYIGKGTRYFASINTQYDPVFGIFNGMRDIGSAALNLTNTPLAGKQAEVIGNAPLALRGIWRAERDKASAASDPWSQLWGDFSRHGGPTGFRELFRTAADRANRLQKELNALDRGMPGKVAHAILDFLDDYNQSIENGVRLSVYKAGLDAGMSKERSASLAKNLNVNFNRRGRSGRELGALYAFFNASAQATTRMVQTLKGPAGRKIILGGIALGVIQAVLALAGFDDDEWDAIPDFVKERSFVIPMPGGNYIAIPYPLGYNILPTLGRTLTEVWYRPDPADQIGSLLMATLDAMNPIGGSTNIVQQLSFTVTDPLVQLYANRKWNDRPIYREDFSPLDPTPGHTRALPGTSEVWKKPAKIINWLTFGTEWTPGRWSPTPEQLRFVFETLTGGVGRETSKTIEIAESAVTGEAVPRYRVPLIGRLFGKADADGVIESRYFANVKRINKLERELKGRILSAKEGQADRVRAAFVEEHPEVALARGIGAIDQARQMINTARRANIDMKLGAAEARILEAMKDFNGRVADTKR
ncbi:MAG: LPD38 domain-containing protein, partial [Bryobacteraceae bacterium]|nr:LPD38 domain-containing protein [Bryobacteraceae bacterium]